MATRNKKAKQPAKEPTDTAALPAERSVLTIPDQPGDIVRAALSPQDMVVALQDYRALQAALDKAMPDQLMQIRGRPFRKKGYWRAVRTAFGLSVEEIPNSEQRMVQGEDWGWMVTYRAIAPNGKYAPGDGTCMASEKKTKGSNTIFATEHNVRSHAHTRAFNRAVSNLVGFGEVSAEEAEHDYSSQGYEPAWTDNPYAPPPELKQQAQPKSEPQKKPEPKKPEPQKPPQDAKLVQLTNPQKELYDAVRAFHDKWEVQETTEEIMTAATKSKKYPGGCPRVNLLTAEEAGIALAKLKEYDAAEELAEQQRMAEKRKEAKRK